MPSCSACPPGVRRVNRVFPRPVYSAVMIRSGGQLTPTLKVKRRVVEQQFNDVIARLYGE